MLRNFVVFKVGSVLLQFRKQFSFLPLYVQPSPTTGGSICPCIIYKICCESSRSAVKFYHKIYNFLAPKCYKIEPFQPTKDIPSASFEKKFIRCVNLINVSHNDISGAWFKKTNRVPKASCHSQSKQKANA